jgi:hypothetical protein
LAHGAPVSLTVDRESELDYAAEQVRASERASWQDVRQDAYWVVQEVCHLEGGK